ncbi:unnamed protein product [Dibothriocephalus latus]|uniref:BACK domain-containing protein n=1 Tax=Dibothriocephalus latus TaxID=60516 RepID=A0A3P7NEC6_DIBLA|nr:unnamed protein product [Dibothriocephalus latus]
MVTLPILENWGIQFLLSTVNTEDLTKTWDFAKSFNIGILMDACLPGMKAQFESFIYSDSFVSLSADTLLTLLQSDNLGVSSEEQVVAAISRWLCPCGEINEQRLQQHVPEMLREVQWQQTSSQFLSRLLDAHPIFQKSAKCSRLMAQVLNWIAAEDKNETPCPYHQHQRPPPSIFIFGKDINGKASSVLRFNPQMKNEERVPDMEHHGGATYSVVGGELIGLCIC